VSFATKVHTSATEAFLPISAGDILFLIEEKENLLKKATSLPLKPVRNIAVRTLTAALFLLAK
jgi:hypothetical protein